MAYNHNNHWHIIYDWSLNYNFVTFELVPRPRQFLQVHQSSSNRGFIFVVFFFLLLRHFQMILSTYLLTVNLPLIIYRSHTLYCLLAAAVTSRQKDTTWLVLQYQWVRFGSLWVQMFHIKYTKLGLKIP